MAAKKKPVKAYIKLVTAAYRHVDSMIPRADDPSSGGPMWFGWALRESFIAGAEYQKTQHTTPPHKAKKKGRR